MQSRYSYPIHSAKIHTENDFSYIYYINERFIIPRATKEMFIITQSDSNKILSTMDKLRIDVAKKANIHHPEKHGHYIHHDILKTINGNGYTIGGYTLSVNAFKQVERLSDKTLVQLINNNKFYVQAYLSTSSCLKVISKDHMKIDTKLGYLMFDIQ